MREIYSQAPTVLMLLVGAAALRWGGRQVRAAAGVTALGWIGTLAVQSATRSVDGWPWLAIVDGFAFLAFLMLAFRGVRGWIVLVLAAQGVAVAVHGIRALAPGMSDWTYLTALAVAGYGLLFALAWGVWRDRAAGQP